MVKKCNKKRYEQKWQAKLALKNIFKTNGKRPWRDEISVYKCDVCNVYHITSIVDINNSYIPIKIKEKGYFEVQKEKWGCFLQNFSNKNGVIQNRKKKYST